MQFILLMKQRKQKILDETENRGVDVAIVATGKS